LIHQDSGQGIQATPQFQRIFRRNLPHGCYVDNIGLSGLLIPAGQSVREVFLTAAPWVDPQTRMFHLRAKVDGNPATLPIQIRVVKP
jgi:hypothetical protein